MIERDQMSFVGQSTAPHLHPLLQEADSAFERGDFVQAGTHYMAVARKAPDNGEAWLGLSRVLLMAGEFDRATELLDRTIAAQHKGRGWLALSRALLTIGEFDRAADLVDRAIGLQPHDSEGYSLQAVIFRKAGNDDGELSALESAVRCSPDNPGLWDALIIALARVSGAEAAIDYLERNADRVPRALTMDLRHAELCIVSGRMREAESRIRAILDAHPGNPDACSVQALLCLNTQRHEDALNALERATECSPSDPQLWETLITVLEDLVGAEAAIDYLERNADRVPKALTIDVLQAQLCVSAGRRQDAELQLRKIVDTNPDNATLKAALASFLVEQAHAALEQGDLVQAGKRYMEVTREAPENGEAWLGLSRVLLTMGEFDRATKLVDRAFALQQKAKAWLALGHVLVTMGEFDRAADLVDRSIALQPTDADAYSLRALILTSTENDEGALDALKHAIQCSPNNPQLWEALIVVLERVSGPEAAIDYLERSGDDVPKTLHIELRTLELCASVGRMEGVDRIVAQRRLRSTLEASAESVAENARFARSLADIGEGHVGIELLRVLMKHHKTMASPFVALADLLRGENTSIPKAIAALRHAISLDPDDISLLSRLSECYARHARYDEAVQLLDAVVERSEEVSTYEYFRLGTILCSVGQVAEGEEYLEKARAKIAEEIADTGADIAQRAAKSAVMARILVALGRREEARAHYKKMVHECGGGALRYHPGLYLPHTPARIERLRHIIRGRDTLILCHGPSIAALADWQEQLGSLDVCISALNRFRVFETGFLSFSGRTVDVLLETHPMVIGQLLDQITEFLERSTDNVLITSRWAMARLGRACPPRREFEGRFDQKLLYFGGTAPIQSATPYDPLRCVFGNSLSILIFLMTIGGARRIFLFGADGGVPAGAPGGTHYGWRKEEFRFEMTPKMREVVAAALRADAVDLHGAVETGLIAAEGLFGINPPPIFNVSPRSALEAFPKITYDDAWSMLSQEIPSPRYS
jgi:tetratricopeptide (TPR) repeat protein